VSSEVFDSGPLNNTDVLEHAFNSPGTYAYHCEIHGCGMSGTLFQDTAMIERTNEKIKEAADERRHSIEWKTKNGRQSNGRIHGQTT
jgi:hypothetical protein